MKKVISTKLKEVFLLFIVNIVICSCLSAQENLTKYVDPFIGTAGHGHTYPGAALPFGMVQLSPDTDVEGWDWCSGYHSSDSSIIGFSHTHLSGTGAADYGDILLMPFTGDIKLEPGSKENPDEGYRSRFSDSTEKASPGYYSVYLEDYKIKVELTAALRVGFHRYKFPNSDSSHIILDLQHGISDRPIEAFIKIISDRKISGYRFSSGWAKDQKVFFVIEFSKPFINNKFAIDDSLCENINLARGKNVKAVFDFSTLECETILVKTAISPVSIEGAEKNLQEELPGWDFDKVRKQADHSWNEELNKIRVEDGTADQKKIFYTAFYHSLLSPNLFMDVDRKYRGMDGKIHTAADHTHYTVFSLWDTFRALHPLFAIIDPKRTNDFIKTLYYDFTQSGTLPVWELAANETWTMIGYHSIPVIVDAMVKGIIDFDPERLYEAMEHSAMMDFQGLEYYKKMGFVPFDKADDAVSRTLEYAYDDWCIAQAAKYLSKDEDFVYYMQRAQNYRNVFNDETKFMRGRKFDGSWRTNFDPAAASGLGAGEFTEGNSWQYTWFVPQDVYGLIELMGGNDKFCEKLDRLFSEKIAKGSHKPADMTGLIGQYAHGNEPSHHIAYLYSYVGKPWKTQQRIDYIRSNLYSAERSGLCGNEDCGQMSAWYVFSALGFYPVTPCSNNYVLGTPLFGRVTINLENGKQFIISDENNSGIYIQNIKINNKEYSKSYITYEDIINGSEISIVSGSEPNYEYGKQIESSPVSKIDLPFVPVEEKYIFAPGTGSDQSLFIDELKINLISVTPGAKIFFTLNGKKPDTNSIVFENRFTIDKTTVLQAVAYRKDLGYSEIFRRNYSRSIFREQGNPYYQIGNEIYPQIKLENKFADYYSGGGEYGLLDGVRGSADFMDGKWQGFEGKDLIAEIDLGKETKIAQVKIGFLKKHASWIFYPKQIDYYFAGEDKNYIDYAKKLFNEKEKYGGVKIKEFVQDFKGIKVRYLKIHSHNIGVCPEWHHAAGGKSWIFADEIVIVPSDEN